jgi:hypothetical protein
MSIASKVMFEENSLELVNLNRWYMYWSSWDYLLRLPLQESEIGKSSLGVEGTKTGPQRRRPIHEARKGGKKMQ